MSTIITVIYPKTETSTFGSDYYITTHMPLVQEKWGPYGLTNWIVTKLDESGGYTYQTILWFESKRAFGEAVAAEGPTVTGDVGNFSSEQPLLVVGEEVKKAA
ncbi:hypothetical protein EAE96_007851 [Botrytis aclada]|nr:hypothetical protein EAE96_007851 [Botrytis aclada]